MHLYVCLSCQLYIWKKKKTATNYTLSVTLVTETHPHPIYMFSINFMLQLMKLFTFFSRSIYKPSGRAKEIQQNGQVSSYFSSFWCIMGRRPPGFITTRKMERQLNITTALSARLAGSHVGCGLISCSLCSLLSSHSLRACSDCCKGWMWSALEQRRSRKRSWILYFRQQYEWILDEFAWNWEKLYLITFNVSLCVKANTARSEQLNTSCGGKWLSTFTRVLILSTYIRYF